MSNPISSLFGRSPIRPIQEHMEKAQQCVVLLGDYLEASFQDNWIEAEKLQGEISNTEKEADQLKYEIRISMPKNIMLPVARTDLLNLLNSQDKLANRTKDIAGLMLGRRMQVPEGLRDSMRTFYQQSLAASEQALKTINELDELLETGFRGKEVQFVEKLLQELDELEHQNDVTQIGIRAALFKLESELPPVNVMFLYRVIDLIGDIADTSQSIGNRLSILIAS
jgi:predicted phosphate transport protein (TIGR00153 family)